MTLRWASLRYPLGSVVAWTATVVGGVAGIAALAEGAFAGDSARETIWGVSLAVIALISFAIFAYYQLAHASATAIAGTLGQQAQASDMLLQTRNFLRVHALAHRQGIPVPADVLGRARHRIQEALTIYANIFSATTKTRCRFCVKLIRLKPDVQGAPTAGDFYLYALARDELSASENKIDDQKRTSEFLDALKDNSDFVRLWSDELSDEGVFFCGDLRKAVDYESSSLNFRRNIMGSPNRNHSAHWPLWYVSTIVWPIRQEKNDGIGIPVQTQHGFLTVDSRVRNVFDREVHVSMGRILSNALFPVLDLYTELLD